LGVPEKIVMGRGLNRGRTGRQTVKG